LLATGTYRNGILMAPAVAALICAVLTDTPAPLANPYEPTARPHRSQPTLQHLLAEGAAPMVSVLLDPYGALPYDRETQLSTTLTSLLNLALSDGQDVIAYRNVLREQLAAHPMGEGICSIFDTWESSLWYPLNHRPLPQTTAGQISPDA
jgi:glycine oxidase